MATNIRMQSELNQLHLGMSQGKHINMVIYIYFFSFYSLLALVQVGKLKKKEKPSIEKNI